MKLFKDEPKIKFLNKKWYAFGLSGAIILGGIYMFFTRGFNKGIDFTGGTMVEVAFKDPVTVARLRNRLQSVNMGGALIQKVGGENRFFIKTMNVTTADADAGIGDHLLVAKTIRGALMNPADKPKEAAGLLDLNNSSQGSIERFLTAKGSSEDEARESAGLIIGFIQKRGLFRSASEFDNLGLKHRVVALMHENSYLSPFSFLRVETVGPLVSRELTRKAVLACIWALIAMLIYIAVRFKFLYGLSGILTLAHDVLVTLSFILFFNVEVDLTVIAAVLTIVGYSINDTIVIFDRLRDNLKIMRKDNLEAILDASINQTLSRTIITSGTVFLTVLAIFLFGGEVIYPFAFTMLVGVISGSYSTIYQSCGWLKIWERWFMKRKIA
jgi:preprotein translocase subunit SecF